MNLQTGMIFLIFTVICAFACLNTFSLMLKVDRLEKKLDNIIISVNIIPNDDDC